MFRWIGSFFGYYFNDFFALFRRSGPEIIQQLPLAPEIKENLINSVIHNRPEQFQEHIKTLPESVQQDLMASMIMAKKEQEALLVVPVSVSVPVSVPVPLSVPVKILEPSVEKDPHISQTVATNQPITNRKVSRRRRRGNQCMHRVRSVNPPISRIRDRGNETSRPLEILKREHKWNQRFM